MPVIDAASQSTLPLQLFQQAMPVSTPPALRECLLKVWLQLSEVTACHLSFVVGSEFIWSFSGADDGESAETGSIQIESAPAQWSATHAGDHFASVYAKSHNPGDSLTVVPFELEGSTVGGILLFGNVTETDVLGTLADVSARLIAQLRGLSAAPESIAGDQLSPALDQKLRDLKLEAMAEFAAGAGHEINNPIATIAGRTALLLKSETDPETRRILETIGGQAYRVRDMIGDAMTFARPPEPRFEQFAAADQVREVIESVSRQFDLSHVELLSEVDDRIQLVADREQFRVVVSCLARNALEAVGQSGRVTVQLSQIDVATEDTGTSRVETLLTVSDSGPGLTETEREHLFDPFYSGRQAGRGLGFGLSRCWQILRRHGGSIHLVDSSDSGVTITCCWPSEPAVMPASLPAAESR